MLNSILPPPKQTYSSAPRELQQQRAPQNTNSLIPLNNSAKNKSENFSVLGRHDKKVVYGSSKDLVAYNPEEDRTRPSEEDEYETTQRTKAALERILNGKISASHPSKPADNNREITYFQYTPNSDNATPNAGSKQRVVKLVEVQQDPLEPPKFKHQKVARGPGSPPVPIMHSPPRKLTQQDVADWTIPSCISNWKNQKGYTISLDKRLAADGRGLQKPQINDKFAVFSESLYLAERNAREMVESRLQIKEKLLQKQKKQKEEALTELAKHARMERSKIMDEDEDDYDNEKRERDRLREERRKQTEREMRLENLVSSKKKKRDEDRDVSEAIALGKAVPKATTGEGMFDQRLFNQTQGISQGFGAEDSYNVYDKPLFHGSAATQLFRPKKSEIDPYSGEDDLEKLKQSTTKFRPDKGFAGTQSDKPIQPRNKPVQFEKDDLVNDVDEYEDEHRSGQQPQDEFGLDEFLDDVKRGKGSVILPSDRRSTLHASSTSSVSSSDRQSSRNIQFTGQSENSSYSAPHKSFESKSSSNYKLSDKQYNNNNNNNNNDDSLSPPRRSNRRSRSPSPRRSHNRSRSPSSRRTYKRSPSPRRRNNRSRSPSPRRYSKKSPSPRRSYKRSRSPSPRRSHKRSRSPPRRSYKRSRSPSPQRSYKRQNY